MKLPESKAWRLPSKAAFTSLLQALKQPFAVRHKPGRVQSIEALDNFDWDLWYGGYSLVRLSGAKYQLDIGERELETTALHNPARFWWDFPEDECRAVLKKVSPLRAFLPIATVRYAVHRYELLNADDKIVVRIKLIQHYSAESQQSRTIIGVHLEATPLMGYQDEFQRALNIIEQAGFESAPLPSVRQLCIAQGVQAREKPGKRFALKADMPAEQAVRLMGQKMLDLALEQKPGLIDDIDTEFLHQYRVHLRKLRSLITLMKRVLAPDLQTNLQAQLRQAFAPTNRLRDLDVFLLERNHYQSLLPDSYTKGLTALFDHVTRERQKCQNGVARTLSSKSHQRCLDSIRALLESEPAYQGEWAEKPIGKLAKKRIKSRYRKVCRLGNAMDANTPDDDVHQLRKECKKLRYLMEFFAELFPKKTISKLIKQLKSLQDVLGDFNDFAVQQMFLSELAQKEKSQYVLAAVNGLIGVLHQQQIDARGRIEDAFAHFSDPNNTAAFNSLSVSE